MTARAPYNRDTLALIRQGASASSLGWEQSFYTSICRRHGIEPAVAAVTTAVPAAEPTPIQQEIARAAPPPVDDAVCRIMVELGEVSRGAATIELTGQQINVLCVLARAAPHEFVARTTIARKVEISSDGVANYIALLRAHLRRLGLLLDSRMGRGGGWRIVDQRTHDPVRFDIRKGGA